MTSTIHMTGINAINRRKMKVAMPSSTHILGKEPAAANRCGSIFRQ
jgi:hypothetical protein